MVDGRDQTGRPANSGKKLGRPPLWPLALAVALTAVAFLLPAPDQASAQGLLNIPGIRTPLNRTPRTNRIVVPKTNNIKTNNIKIKTNTVTNTRIPGNGRITGDGHTKTGFPKKDARHPHVPNLIPVIPPGIAVGPAGGPGPDATVVGPTGPAGPITTQTQPTLVRRGSLPPPNNERRYVVDHVLIEVSTSIPQQTVVTIAQRHRLALLSTSDLALLGSRLYLFRITDRRSVPVVIRALGGERQFASIQPDYLFMASEEPQPGPAPQADPPKATTTSAPPNAPVPQGDPAQYVVGKLRLTEAHRLATGDKILVAVIDSGIDDTHPDLAGMIAAKDDTLGDNEKPHSHGTAMAGAIVSHGRLMGIAPAARILAVRAFGAVAQGAQGTSFSIVKGIEWATAAGARIINMSFAGPADPMMQRELAAAKAKGVVLIAAAGNAGPKSPPLYPAADPNVIAVTATDANDRLYANANRGKYIAISAPGVDILAAAPEGSYQVSTGTSIAAAHVSGVVALMLQRQGSLDPDAVRRILQDTARDLGPKGRDDEFGAGLADPLRALNAIGPPVDTAGAAPVR